MVPLISINLMLALTMLVLPCHQEKRVEQDYVDYKLTELKLEGKTIFDLEKLAATFGMKRGDSYDPKCIRAKMEEIQRLFYAYGYIDFIYVPTTNINSAEKTVFCFFLLLPGKQYFVKQITIYDSEIAYDKEIRSVLSAMSVEEGKIFSSIGLEFAIINLKKFLKNKDLDLKDYEYKRSSSDGMVEILIRLQPRDN